jgi:hypothetical protein
LVVHGLDPATTDVLEHGRDDGGEQQGDTEHLLGQPLAADLDPGRAQALVLAIQRQVIEELVDDQPGEEAHIGTPALEHRRRGGRAGQGGRFHQLDHRAHVLEHHVAARTLSQAMGHLLADHRVGLGGQVGDLGVGQPDGLHRHPRGIEEQGRLLDLGTLAAPALVGGDRLGGLGTGRGAAQISAEGQLLGRGLEVAALGLLAEQLAFEPLQLAPQLGVLGFQSSDLARPIGHGRGGWLDAGEGAP